MPMESWTLDLGSLNWGARDKMEGTGQPKWYGPWDDIYDLQMTIVSIWGGEEWVRL